MSNTTEATEQSLAILKAVGLPDPKELLTAEAKEQRQSALESAALLLTISNAEEQQEVATAASELKAFNKGVENARLEFKRLLIAAGAALDGAASAATEKTAAELKRLENLLTEYHLEQERKVEAARAEQRRIEEEARKQREEAERKRQQEEQARQAEIERLRQESVQAENIADRQLAANEAARLQEEQLASELAAEFEQPAPAPYVPQVVIGAPTKAKGVAVKKKFDYEVTDISAFYRAFPQFCTLKEKPSELKAFINLTGTDFSKIPGVRVFEVVTSTTRAAKPAAVIAV